MKHLACILLTVLVLLGMSQTALAATEADIDSAYTATGDYLQSLGAPKAGGLGGEWLVLGFARGGRGVDDSYHEDVVAYVQSHIDDNGRIHQSKVTMNCRFIISLTALGKDVTNVGGHNLLTALDDLGFVQKSGISGLVWTLLSFDCGRYATGKTVTREVLVDKILAAQVPGGGWAVTGTVADPDMTAMTIQALALYREEAKVASAVDKALAVLSQMQDETGNFPTQYGTSSESVSQIIVALSTLGIDANADTRFLKNGNSPLDALLSYQVEDGGFRHILSGKRDALATEQGYYALTAYNRMKNGQLPLYQMWDVASQSTPSGEGKEETSFLWLYATLGAGIVLAVLCFLMKKKLGKRRFANAIMVVVILEMAALGMGAVLNLGLLQPKQVLGSSFSVREIPENRLYFSENPENVCTITIRCDTVLKHLPQLDEGKVPYVPADGVILPKTEVEFTPGESVFDVLRRVCEAAEVSMEYSWAPLYDAYYLEGINHLYELDCGTESGWMYRVNGSFPNYGCSDFKLQPGDEIQWLYTCVGTGADLNE